MTSGEFIVTEKNPLKNEWSHAFYPINLTVNVQSISNVLTCDFFAQVHEKVKHCN